MKLQTYKFIFLFIAIWFTLINTFMLFAKRNIPFINIFIQALGITGFIILQFLI